MDQIGPLSAMEQIAPGIDHAEWICWAPATAARADIMVPDIGRRHVTRFRVPGLTGVPLFHATRDQIGG